MRSQLGHARQQLAARRTVERAKGVLMAEAGLDEEQAHSRLRKLAMDRGKRLVDVAESIIEARDLLRPGGG